MNKYIFYIDKYPYKKTNIKKLVIEAENFPTAYNKVSNNLKQDEQLSMCWLDYNNKVREVVINEQEGDYDGI